MIDAEGKQLGVFITSKAIEMAESQGLDLVELSPNAVPPVCKIMDFGKYKYQQTKKIKEAKKHQVIVLGKEVKFRPVTDDHDLDFKVRNMEGFLAEGHNVKATVVFRGREMAHPELGRRILERVAERVADIAHVESAPKQDGRNMTMVLNPIRKPKPKAQATA